MSQTLGKRLNCSESLFNVSTWKCTKRVTLKKNGEDKLYNQLLGKNCANLALVGKLLYKRFKVYFKYSKGHRALMNFITIKIAFKCSTCCLFLKLLFLNRNSSLLVRCKDILYLNL